MENYNYSENDLYGYVEAVAQEELLEFRKGNIPNPGITPERADMLVAEAVTLINADLQLQRAAWNSEDDYRHCLRQMIKWNLSIEKNQCYIYGENGGTNRLIYKKSYYGMQVLVRRHFPEIAKINASVIRQGENVQLGNLINGVPERIIHTGCSLKTQENEIIGAYAVILDREGKIISYSLLNRSLLDTCSQRRNSPVYKKYPADMYSKIALLRAVKPFFSISDGNAESYEDFFDEEEKTAISRQNSTGGRTPEKQKNSQARVSLPSSDDDNDGFPATDCQDDFYEDDDYS